MGGTVGGAGAVAVFWFLVFWLLNGESVHWNEEHFFELFRTQTCFSQLLNHRHLLCFVFFTRYELFRDEVALRPHASAVGITSRFYRTPFRHTRTLVFKLYDS